MLRVFGVLAAARPVCFREGPLHRKSWEQRVGNLCSPNARSYGAHFLVCVLFSSAVFLRSCSYSLLLKFDVVLNSLETLGSIVVLRVLMDFEMFSLEGLWFVRGHISLDFTFCSTRPSSLWAARISPTHRVVPAALPT